MANLRSASNSHHSREAKYRNWDAYEERRDELSPFKDLLQRDPRVCDHCFTLRYEELSCEWYRGEFGWSMFSVFIPIQRDERHRRFEREKVGQGVRLACGNCGRRGSKERPLSKEQLHDAAVNISQTLTEKGIDHDEGLFIEQVWQRNTSDRQGRQDSDVLAPAVNMALRARYDNLEDVVEQHRRA